MSFITIVFPFRQQKKTTNAARPSDSGQVTFIV